MSMQRLPLEGFPKWSITVLSNIHEFLKMISPNPLLLLRCGPAAKKTDGYEGVAAHKKKTKIDQIIPATATICSRHRYEGVWNKERNPNRSARHSNCHHSHPGTEIGRCLSQGKNQKRWPARESNCQHSRVQRLPAGHMSAWFQYISSIMQPWSAVLTQETSLMFMNSG